MGKNKVVPSKSIFPPFEFGLSNNNDDATPWGLVYELDAEEIERFIDFLNLASKLIIKHAEKIYHSTLSEYERKTGEEMPEEDESRLIRVMYWGTHEEFIYETIFVRLVEMFLIYLTDLADGIMRSRGYSDDEREKKMKRISTFSEIKQHFASIEFALFTSKRDAAEVERIIAVRNLLVHKSGYVDDRFLWRFPSLKGISGIREVEEGLAVVRLNRRTVRKYGTVLSRVVSRIDKRAIKKFDLITLEKMLQKTRRVEELS